MIVIADSTAMIGLHAIGRLEILLDLFQTVIIPPVVAEETLSVGPLPSWIRVQTPRRGLWQTHSGKLGDGEKEAIGVRFPAVGPDL